MLSITFLVLGVFPMAFLFAKWYEAMGIPPYIGWLLLGVFILLWISSFFISARLINGKLYESGLITFAPDGIEIFEKVNAKIPYTSITYLSAYYDRPEKSTDKRPLAKTYLVHIIDVSNNEYKLIIARVPEQSVQKKDLIDLLEFLRRQDHSIYKAFRGVKREYGDA